MTYRPKLPALGRLRLASVNDIPQIKDITNESMSHTFRVESYDDIVYLIENCVLSICQLDIYSKVIGFLAARDYPRIPSVHPAAWEDYIWTKFKAVELNSRNTMFIHHVCWNPGYTREVLDGMLFAIFMHDPYVDYIAMVKSLSKYPNLIPGQSRMESSFRRVTCMERGVSADSLPVLCIADRNEVCPKLRIRRAVEEDNDDIIPIIHRQSERLREIYGEFYISELVSRHPESERVLLVCEHKELAVGVMCLNTLINFEALEDNFELSPFAGLRKITTPFQDRKMSESDLSVGHATATTDDVETKKEIEQKIRFSEAPEPVAEIVPKQSQAVMGVLPLLDDEESMEYDIVNIDQDHLKVPKYLAHGYQHGVGDKKQETKKVENKAKPKKSTSRISPAESEFKPIRYEGPPNAFLIELFAMHHEYDDRYGFDILEAVFEIFPDRDYCILCLPSNHVSFPLLDHFTLVTPFQQRPKFINETLYVAHVNSVRGDVCLRRGEPYDLVALRNILQNAPRAEAILKEFEMSIRSHVMESFVMLSQKQAVGVIILSSLDHSLPIRAQYDLEAEPRRPGTDGFVLAGVMSPIMEPHSRWYLRDVLRQSKFSTLFWLCKLFCTADMSPSRNLMSLACHMTPVHPRQSIPNICGDKDLDIILQDFPIPFALWVIESPLTSLPKIYVNNAIVVVGASRTGLAFIEDLILGPASQYLTFSNITLISEHGLPTVSEFLPAAYTCVPSGGRYNDKYLKKIPFYFYIDIISAVMVGLDRKKKCIYLKDGTVKFYDELVLTCGRQFQHPEYLRDPLELAKEVLRGKPCDRMLMDNPLYQPDRVPLPPDMPDNVFIINSLYQANSCLKKLMNMIERNAYSKRPLSEEHNILVYGDCIESYCCIAALLELGIQPQHITFIEPFPPEDNTLLRVNCFNNETVDERMQETLVNMGIKIHRKYYLFGWELNGKIVTEINLMSQLHYMVVPCFAVFYYGLKAIDIYAFKAINESGLVYDGGLVVGPAFETNDKCVFGAGTSVKYSRSLYADTCAHCNYSSEDVGEALARIFLRKMDPFVIGDDSLEEQSDFTPIISSSLLGFRSSHPSMSSATRIALAAPQTRNWQPVMKFDSPIALSATLPGPLYYMKMRKPGNEIPMEVQMSLPHQGHTLITDLNGRYFRLQLNKLHCVEAITCLSNEPFSTEIFIQLYGKHEAFFNKLLTRFQLGQITDLFEFFTQPWMSAMYMETFRGLLTDINEQDVGTIYDLVRSRFSLHDQNKSRHMNVTSSTEFPEGALGPMEARNLGTFRSVVDRYVARNTSLYSMIQQSCPTDIPTECGQCLADRTQAANFWKTVGGDDILIAHLTRYLSRNSCTHPHYAQPRPEFS